MEFYRYLNVLKKSILLIVFMTVLGAGSAYIFSKRQHKVYSATTTLSINAAAPASIIPFLANAVSGSGGVAPVEQLANSYSVFLKQRSFDQTVADKLHLGVAPGALAAHITSALIPNTNYFQISVTWGDPNQAATIANTISDTFLQENKTQQAATQGAQTNSDLNQSLNYFHSQLVALQNQYNALLRNPRSSLTRVTALGDRLSTVSDEYYRLLGTAGPNAPQTTATNTASVQDRAIASGLPISPKVTSNTFFGLVAGLFLGLGLAFLLDFLDYSLHTPEDVEHLVGQAPLGIVGMIGVDSPQQRGLLFGRKTKPTPAAMTVPPANGNGLGATAAATLIPLTVLNPQLVTLNHPKAPITEGFRTLRTNLDFSALDKPLKSLVITSSVPSEGKSTIAANLAVAEAQAGKRVILVDADLRRPSLGKIFGLKPSTGFTTVLLNRENRARAIDEALQPTVVPNLFVMTSGPHPPNPAELLASHSATEVLRELEERADLVIFDTPPMGPLTDAVVLSARVDGTMIVTRAGSTRRTLVSNSVNTIKKVGGNVVGTVLNMVDLKGISSYSYYYYYSTEYYGHEEPAANAAGARR